MNWLKRNFFVVLIVAAIVSLSLVLVPIYNAIDALDTAGSEQYQRLLWMNIANYTCIAAAEVMFIIIASKRSLDKTLIMVAILLFFVSDIAITVYRMIEYKEYVGCYYILIDVALMIFMIMSLTNKRYFLTTLVILLVEAATSLLGTFNGSSIEFSKLILDFMLLFSIYFYSNNEQVNSDYNYYS